MKNWLVLSTLLFLAACNNDNKVEEEPEEQTTDTEEIFPTDSLAQFHRFLREQNIQYSQRRYAPAEEFALQTFEKEITSENDWKPFAALLVKNASGDKAIDLFSGNYVIIEKQGRKKLRAGEPDTELAIIDIKANTRERILYIGPSYNIFDAAWTSDNSIIAAGGEVIGDEKIQPIVWTIDLLKKTGRLYRYPDTLFTNAPDFLSKKYPSVDF